MEQWFSQICHLWAEHSGIIKKDVMREYLKIAQDLEMYGVTYFQVTNKTGTKLLLGIDSRCLTVYDYGNRLYPKIGFQWSELNSALFKKNQFIIKPLDKNSPPFVCYTERNRVAKRILLLAKGNFFHFKNRRLNKRSFELEQILTQENKLKKEKDLGSYGIKILKDEHIKQLEIQLKQTQLEKHVLEQKHSDLDRMYRQLSKYCLEHEERSSSSLSNSKMDPQLNTFSDDEDQQETSLNVGDISMKNEQEELRQITVSQRKNLQNQLKVCLFPKKILFIYVFFSLGIEQASYPKC